MVASVSKAPEVSFQVRSACARGQVRRDGAGEQARVVGLAKLLLKRFLEVGCSQEPAWQRGGRICDRAEGLEVPLRWVPLAVMICDRDHPSSIRREDSVSPAGGQERHVTNPAGAAADAGRLP